MNTKFISKNTPINHGKADLYNRLIAFFETYSILKENSGRIGEVMKSINRFENGHRMKMYDMTKLKVVDYNAFRKYTPCHKRKRAFFKALVAFFDAVLEQDMKHTIKKDYTINDLYFFANVPMTYLPNEMGMRFIKKDIRDFFSISEETTKTESTEEPQMKEYTVNVHFDVVVPMTVEALDEEGAIVEAEQNVVLLDYTTYNITKSEIVK